MGDHPRGAGPVVKALCDLRLAALALLALTEALVGARTWTLVVLLLAIPLSYLPLRRWESLGSRWVRTRWFAYVDSAVLVVVLVGFGVGSSALVYAGATLALTGVACRAEGAAVSLLAVVGLHAVALAGAVGGQPDVGDVTGLLGRLMLLAGCTVLGRRLGRLLHDTEDLQRQVHRGEVLRAHAEERTRLAQEMHDSLSKTLHGIHLLASSLTGRLERDGSTRVAEARALVGAADVARRDARELLGDLRQAPPEELVRSVGELAEIWAAEHPGTHVVTELDEQDLDLGPGARYEVTRSVSELLENVARHSGARRVRVAARAVDGWVEVEVADDGRGMSVPDLAALHTGGHYGLVGVHERLRRVNGTVRVDSTPGQGTHVVLRLPAALVEGAR